jgi:malate dehydrogenase (oxaloacetate-decarboxylating)(NADP+)
MTLMAAEEVKKFGITPKIALLSHSDFGNPHNPEAGKMAEATRLIKEKDPTLEAEGEMTASAALSEEIRSMLFPNSELKGQANLLIMPNIDAANITFHMLKVLGDGIVVGPLLLGARKSAHILIPSVTSRGILNAAAYACAGAGFFEKTAPNKNKDKVTRLKKRA